MVFVNGKYFFNCFFNGSFKGVDVFEIPVKCIGFQEDNFRVLVFKEPFQQIVSILQLLAWDAAIVSGVAVIIPHLHG